MYGCPINEAWGDDFSKKKKKKHKPPLSPQEDNLLVSESEKVQFNEQISAYQKLQGLETGIARRPTSPATEKQKQKIKIALTNLNLI